MARSTATVVTVTDDLTGKKLAEPKVVTVRFAVDGQRYELDTDSAGEATVREAEAKAAEAYAAVMADFVSKARPVKSAGKSRDMSDVREWAKSNGHNVGDRGRIPADVLEAYSQAQA